MERADLAKVYAHIDRHLDRYIDEAADFCRIPSVSGDPAAMNAAESWLRTAFERMGCTVASIPRRGSLSLRPRRDR